MSFIETERLLLRTWLLPADLSDAIDIFTNESARSYYIRGDLARNDVERYIRGLMEKQERDGFGVWPAIEKSSRTVIGACGLTPVPDLGGEIEIDWIVKPSARGQGYATEAARAVLAYAFAHAGLRHVCALIDPENRPSVALANSIGMRFDRVVRAYKRDLLRYVKDAA